MNLPPLEAELQVFEAHREEWCAASSGKFAVIQAETVLDEFFDDWTDAFKAGAARFGAAKPFLVKQIWEVDPIYYI